LLLAEEQSASGLGLSRLMALAVSVDKGRGSGHRVACELAISDMPEVSALHVASRDDATTIARQ